MLKSRERILAGCLLFGILVCASQSLSVEKAFAQQVMSSSTSGGKLDVKLEPSCTDTDCKFKVTFLQPHSQTVQVHIDYDFTVSKNNVTVFDAAKSTGQQTLHTAEGSVTIPVKLNDSGTYNATVTLTGVLFVPINPETANFAITVAPEFPSGIAVTVAGLMAVAIVVPKMAKLRKLREKQST